MVLNIDVLLIIVSITDGRKFILHFRERILSFKSSSLWYRKSLLPHLVTPLKFTIFIMHVRNYVMGATSMTCTAVFVFDHFSLASFIMGCRQIVHAAERLPT